ncbi:DUF1236 domain-containing protein [Bradyrhizobium sp. LHD-71]|uniref:DUF1236 domain-containing protein n=1 Tax=Bradyrhizobium sp. LHD-71 TaxID=3072141 RepID=UPI0028100746|nr:DUF1236 domain-containing protein [Bradyrhizobium sp. LHD-71]MDQ8729484.1 DUF1236 domain-containing protein [Bradyrhizobium sp. LHD-71]
MTKLFLVSGILAALTVGAQAQMATVKLTAEDNHTIKEIVLNEMKTPKAASGDYKIGEKVPEGIELRAFPASVGSKVSAVKSHRFFVSGERIIVVHPKDNTIAEIIE